VNDQKTADGSLVPMAKAGELTAASSVLVPIVLEAGGLGGSYYTSELVLANRSTKSGTAVLRYVGAPLFGGAGTGTVRVPLAAGSQKVLDGVLAYLRTNGLPIPTAGAQGGALFVTFEGFDATDDVYAGVRTGTPNPDAAQGGTFGVFSAGVPSAALATSSAIVPGLRLDASARTNVAAVNAGDSPITLEIKLRSFEGFDAGRTLTRTLAPGEWYQWSNVFDLAGAGAGDRVITRTAGVELVRVRRSERLGDVRRQRREHGPVGAVSFRMINAGAGLIGPPPDRFRAAQPAPPGDSRRGPALARSRRDRARAEAPFDGAGLSGSKSGRAAARRHSVARGGAPREAAV
jgi:hypothetical protein